MGKIRWFAAGGLALVLTGAVIWEYRAHQISEQRYQQAVEGRRQLEGKVREMLASHDQLKTDLANERERSKQLEAGLAQAKAKLEETQTRLAEETKSLQELQSRFSAMQTHMDQLQGELAMSLQQRQAFSAGQEQGKEVQLERIVVTRDDASALQGRVISIHPDWNFVVLDLGWDQVKIGETVSIFRDKQLLAKARIERIQEKVCAATILPEWAISEVHVNDAARIL